MKRGTAFKSILVLLAVAAGLCATALAWMMFAPRRVPEGQPSLTVLDGGSLPAFREAFNARGGEVRVLALLSPT